MGKSVRSRWVRRNSSLRATETKRRNKIKAIVYKGGKCARCGVRYPPCIYDFHHLDSKTKIARGSTFLSWRWSRMKEELDKCILLCSNCHRLEHYKGLINSKEY